MLRLGGIGLEMTESSRVVVALVVEKMVETRLRWFDHVERRPLGYVCMEHFGGEGLHFSCKLRTLYIKCE